MSELKTSVLIMHQNMLFSKSKQFHTAADGASSNKSHPCVIHTLTSMYYIQPPEPKKDILQLCTNQPLDAIFFSLC